MSFFYDLNKKLDGIRATPEVTHQQLNERDMSRAAKGYEKYGKQGMEALAKAGRDGKALDPVRKKYDKYDEGQDFGPGPSSNDYQAGPSAVNPDFENYKTPNLDSYDELSKDPDTENFRKEKVNSIAGPISRGGLASIGASNADARGQNKYVDRTSPGMINKIKDKLGYDMPDPAYGPRPDETQRLAKRYPAPAKSVDEDMYNDGGVYKDLEIEPKRPQQKEKGMTRGTRPAPKGDSMGTIKGGVWTADPPKRGEKGVPAPSGDPEGVKEAAGSIDYEKVLEAIAALYGDDMWNNDAMGDLAQDLEQAGPTDRELDFIIAKGKLPTRLKNIRFTNTDDVQFGHLDEKNGAPMTATGKKLNFADKIANAKKEVDEMLGDVAAEAMRSALSPKQKKIDMNKNGKLDANDFAMLRKGAKPEMDEERSKGTAFDPDTPRASTPRVGSIERGHKHDIKHTATGRMVTRRTDDQGNSVGADDDSEASGEKRGRGRPKGTKQSIGAKGPSGKSKLMTREGDQDITDQGEYDQEGDMAKDDIKTIMRHAQALSKVLGDNDNLPEWVQSKLAKIEGMMISIDEYMQNQEDEEEPIAEKAVSKQQQKFMGMAHAMQKGEKVKGASKELKKVASTMKPKDTEDFAKTKHKGLPNKKKKEVDENSEDGRLTVKQTGPGQTSTSSSTGRINATIDNGKMSVKPAKSGGTSYGKGIYDSMNHELEQMIAESMNISMSDSTEGSKSLTITATDEDALKLGMLLKNAGLGGGDAHGGDMHSHGEEPCETCGMPDCGCGDVQEAVDENSPDYPTNTEQADNNFGYAGGLNKPKADVAGDGQSTVPVVATRPHNDDLRRMREMAGIQNEDNIDLGPTSPEIASMSSDEVNAALRLGMSPDISGMDPDEVNAEFSDGNDSNQYEDSIQRMREMAGIKEAKKQVDQNNDGKNDFEDIKIARMKASGAIDNKEEKKVDESIFALTNQWKAYKG